MAEQDKSKSVVIVNHRRSHCSDFGADFLLQNYGEHVWPGVAQSRVLVVEEKGVIGDDGKAYSLNMLKERGWTIIGVGPVKVPGFSYDEHFLDEKPEELRTCEMILVAEALGLEKEKALIDLLEYARAVDRYGEGKKPFYLGRLVEIMHDVLPEEHEVRRWACEAFIAELGSTRRFSQACFLKARDLFDQAFAKVERDFPPEVLRSVSRLAGFMINEHGEPYRFTALDIAMRLVEMRRVCGKWLEYAIRAELMRQYQFFEAKREYEHKTRIEGPLRGSWKHKRFNVLFIASDARMVHSYAFSADPEAAAVIVRRGDGHCQIFVNMKWRSMLPHAAIAVNVRRAEQALAGIINVPDEMLAMPAGPLGAANWFYQRDTGNLYNGSLTATDVPATKLSDKEILEAVVAALKK